MNNRERRIGYVTTGLSMVVFGILFILHTCFGMFTYQTIYRLWPLILIGLGIEILLSGIKSDNWKYDKGAIVILILMTCLTMCLAGVGIVLVEYNMLVGI